MLLSLLADESSQAYQAGHKVGMMIGMAVPIVLSVAGAIWCGAILARPKVNQKGVGALLTVFAGWTLALIITLAQKAASGGTAYSVAIAGVVGLTIVVAISLAIAALVDDGDYVQGRGQGIAAMALSGVMGMVLVFGISMGASRAAQNMATTMASQGQPVVMDAERYRLKALPRPWVQTNAKKLNELASLGLMRTRPESYFIVIAEKLDPGAKMDLQEYTAAVKSNFLNGSADGKILTETLETIEGKVGVRLICTAKLSGLNLVYRYWLHVGTGTAYQVISWTQGTEPAALLTQTQPLFSALEILPPQ